MREESRDLEESNTATLSLVFVPEQKAVYQTQRQNFFNTVECEQLTKKYDPGLVVRLKRKI